MALQLPIRLGTRGSPLALAQAEEVRDRLAQAHATVAAPDAIELVPLTTTGDRVTDRPLAEIGGKGLFTEEIEVNEEGVDESEGTIEEYIEEETGEPIEEGDADEGDGVGVPGESRVARRGNPTAGREMTISISMR